jgi:hypothetical protein
MIEKLTCVTLFVHVCAGKAKGKMENVDQIVEPD